jgi:hypothetical protein
MTRHNIVSNKDLSRRYLGAGYGALTFMRPPRQPWNGRKAVLLLALGLAAMVGGLVVLENLVRLS